MKLNLPPLPWLAVPGNGLFDANKRRIAALSFAGKKISQKLSYAELEALAKFLEAAPDLAYFVREYSSASCECDDNVQDACGPCRARELMKRIE